MPRTLFPRRTGGRRPIRPAVAFVMPYAGPVLAGVATGRSEAVAGGAETQVFLLARELVRRGHTVAIAAFDVPGLPGRVAGIDVIALPPRPRTGGLRALTRWRLDLLMALARVDADCLVQRGAGSITGLAALLARARQRPFVYSSSTTIDFESPRMGRTAARLLRLGVRLARAIVVQSDEQQELCLRHWGRRSTVIRSLAEPAPLRSSPPEAFLWVGRLAPYKRPDLFADLAKRLPEAAFWLVGTPSLHDPEAPDRLASIPNLELLETRPRAALAELFERAAAVVSTSEFEGMPNVLLEAWTRGVPALVFSCDPDGLVARHGLGFDAEGSTERFVELARAVWRSREDQTAIAARCRAYTTAEHHPARIAQQWEPVLGLSAPDERPAGQDAA